MLVTVANPTKGTTVRISDLLRAKGSAVLTVGAGATVAELLAALAEHNVGAAVVVGPDGTITGIVSERDVVRRLHDHGAGLLGAVVRQIMTTDVATARADDDVQQLSMTMTERRIRHVPVVDDAGHLAGIVSIGDVVKSRIDELEEHRQRLEDYIAG